MIASHHRAPHLHCYRPARIPMYSSQSSAAHLRTLQWLAVMAFATVFVASPVIGVL